MLTIDVPLHTDVFWLFSVIPSRLKSDVIFSRFPGWVKAHRPALFYGLLLTTSYWSFLFPCLSLYSISFLISSNVLYSSLHHKYKAQYLANNKSPMCLINSRVNSSWPDNQPLINALWHLSSSMERAALAGAWRKEEEKNLAIWVRDDFSLLFVTQGMYISATFSELYNINCFCEPKGIILRLLQCLVILSLKEETGNFLKRGN